MAGPHSVWFSNGAAMSLPSGTDLLSILILAAIGMGLAAHMVRYLRRAPGTLIQGILLLCNLAMACLLWRARISGRFPIPPGQGAVIVCNHISPADPSTLYLATNRVVHWMVAKEYALHPLMARFFRAARAIPVGRGGIDTAATKLAIRHAQNGELVGIFPEGRINMTDQVLLPGRPGAALIAIKAGVPIVPCYLTGSPYDDTPYSSFLMRGTMHLRIGKVIDTSEYVGWENEREAKKELTLRFLREMAQLAGHADFQPQLAGRRYKPGS